MMQPTNMTDLPPELRRRLEQAMLMQQFGQQAVAQAARPAQPQYTPRGRIVKKHPLEYLAQAAQMGLGAYGQFKGMQDAAAVQSEADTARSEDRQAVMQALLGQKARELEGPTPDGSPLMGQAVPGSRQDAIRRASQSRFPSIQQMGGDLQKAMLDQQDKVGAELVKNATTPSAVAYGTTGDLSQLTRRPDSLTVGDAVVNRNPDTGAISPVSAGRFARGSQTVGGVTMPTNIDTWSGKETPTAGVGVSANPSVQVGMDASKSRREFLEKGKEAADSAAATAKSLVEAAKVMQQGYTSGQFADQRVAASKFFGMLGAPIDPKDVNAESIKMLLTQLGINDAAKLKPASDTDMKILFDSIGTINTDPNALARIMDVMFRSAQTNAARYSQQVMEAQEADRAAFGNPNINYQYLLPQITAPIISGGADDPRALFEDLKTRFKGGLAAPQQPGAGTPGRRKIDLTGAFPQ